MNIIESVTGIWHRHKNIGVEHRNGFDDKQFKCLHCGKSYVWKHSLDKHILSVHTQKNKEKPFKCHLCNYAFSDRQGLERHFRSDMVTSLIC